MTEARTDELGDAAGHEYGRGGPGRDLARSVHSGRDGLRHEFRPQVLPPAPDLLNQGPPWTLVLLM